MVERGTPSRSAERIILSNPLRWHAREKGRVGRSPQVREKVLVEKEWSKNNKLSTCYWEAQKDWMGFSLLWEEQSEGK